MNSPARNTGPVGNRDIPAAMEKLGKAARSAAAVLAGSGAGQRDDALRRAAAAVRRQAADILDANAADLAAARSRALPAALIDRLALDAGRLETIAQGLEAIAALPDPLGRVLAAWERPNGLRIERVSVPLGVIGMIYESRPNVTADAAGLCLKAGNAVILRGGSESFHSNGAIHRAVAEGITAAGLPAGAVQLVPTTSREAAGYLLSGMRAYLDVLIPRGGRNLIRRVQETATVPVIGHLEGICHVYLHESADPRKAREIAVNAKMRRTGICGAAETLLVDRAITATILPDVVAALAAAGCEVRGDEAVRCAAPAAVPASEEDWGTEYLDAVISVRTVADIDAAIEHIGRYGSGHTESIVAEDAAAAERFLASVDSAIVMHNASTQFADGGEFGMGAEIGIATGRMHARGPVGAEQLTSYKYVVRGSGQVRP